jgi:glycosyltransferase involved in cell wall biosynthesis
MVDMALSRIRVFEDDVSSAAECDTVVLIPAYNEARHLGTVVLQALKYADLVIVIDDGSTDGTAKVAKDAGAVVIRHPENQGKGAALNSGLCRARELCPQAVVMLDGDGQHHPDEIHRLLAPIWSGEADLVIGSRYLAGEKQIPRIRIWGHRLFTWATNWLSGVVVTDSQSGFRALSPTAVEVISFSTTGFSVESEMQFLARKYGLAVIEVPISADYQDEPKRSVFTHGLMVLRDVPNMVSLYRPSLFFGTVSSLTLFAVVSMALIVIDWMREMGQLVIGYPSLPVLLHLIGVIVITTGIMLISIRTILTNLNNSRNGR